MTNKSLGYLLKWKELPPVRATYNPYWRKFFEYF